MPELKINDYKKILEYYKQQIPRSARLVKINAEKIIATKLCRCIKKVDTQNEARAIGICSKTILNRKGFTRGKFKCKGKASIQLTKRATHQRGPAKKNITRRK
jgi:hypothetical protein